MTNEQINAAIAEVCGWKPHADGVRYYQGNFSIWKVGKCLPDYCNDLNAMHEAESVLKGLDKWSYVLRLTEVTQSQSSDEMSFFCATARQRAEAFLRTLGKWEKGKKLD
jgi:hypothetical protein